MSYSTTPCKVVILISGRGSNMQAIVEMIQQESLAAEVCAVIANNADAEGLQWAAKQGITTHAVNHRDYETRASFDSAMMSVIDRYQPNYIILAGFMRVLTDEFVLHYPQRLVNIHPSLLPLFPGLHTHQQALDSGMLCHGCTVHFVTPVLDNGPIIAQGAITVGSNDTPESLAHRLLPIEHKVYCEVVRWLVQGRITVDAKQKVHVEGIHTRFFI